MASMRNVLALCALLACASTATAIRDLKQTQTVAPPVLRSGPTGCVYTVINAFVAYGTSLCDVDSGCPYDMVPTSAECENNCTLDPACIAYHYDETPPTGTPRCVLLGQVGTTRRSLPGNMVGLKRGSLDGTC